MQIGVALPKTSTADNYLIGAGEALFINRHSQRKCYHKWHGFRKKGGRYVHQLVLPASYPTSFEPLTFFAGAPSDTQDLLYKNILQAGADPGARARVAFRT